LGGVKKRGSGAEARPLRSGGVVVFQRKSAGGGRPALSEGPHQRKSVRGHGETFFKNSGTGRMDKKNRETGWEGVNCIGTGARQNAWRRRCEPSLGDRGKSDNKDWKLKKVVSGSLNHARVHRRCTKAFGRVPFWVREPELKRSGFLQTGPHRNLRLPHRGAQKIKAGVTHLVGKACNHDKAHEPGKKMKNKMKPAHSLRRLGGCKWMVSWFQASLNESADQGWFPPIEKEKNRPS